MKKLYRYAKFQIKTAGKNIARHFGLALSAACSITLTLLLIAVFMLLTSNLANVTTYIETQVTIRASIDKIVDDEQKEALWEEVAGLDNVKNVGLSTGAQELAAYKEEYADESSLFDMYDGDTNPIRDTFVIEVENSERIAETARSIEKLDGIVEADYGGDATQSMMETFQAIQQGSAVFIVFLTLVAIFLISNKIKMSIYTRKSEIAIMRFVGTGNWCIKLPMMLEGIFIGLLGALVPIILTIVSYNWLYQANSGVMISNMFQLQPVFPLVAQVSLLLAGIGMLVGLLGSFFSTTRYLRWKR